MRIIRFHALQRQPWKNGGGTTREIEVFSNEQNMVWRISMADVESNGPFSIFPGLTRILTVVQGSGLRLNCPSGSFDALFGVPVRFDGALPIQSELIGGPVVDLNVMFDEKLCRAGVTLAQASTTFQANGVTAIIGISGICTVNRIHHLEFGDTALIENESADIVFSTKGVALAVTLNLRNK